MNPNSVGVLASNKAPSNVDKAILDIDSLTDDLNNIAGQLERNLHPVLVAAPPSGGEAPGGAEPGSETELLTKLHAQQRRLRAVIGRFHELNARVSI
ncbi:hypothetical protein D3C71_1372240 [compost metagenome]